MAEAGYWPRQYDARAQCYYHFVNGLSYLNDRKYTDGLTQALTPRRSASFHSQIFVVYLLGSKYCPGNTDTVGEKQERVPPVFIELK